MIASHSANRRHRITLAIGVLLVAAGCASRPSLGPQTVTGQPAHVDGGPGQLLRYCATLHDRGKLAMAAAMCERAYQLDPTNPAPLLELASILGEMGEVDLAKRAYGAILQDLPGHAEAHYGLGRIHLDAAEYDLALAQFQAGLRSAPTDARLYNAAGVASGMLGAHAAAQEAFRAGLEVAPDDMRLRNNLGLSLVQNGDYKRGVQMLQAVAKDPAAEKTNLENLDMALSVAAAAQAEAVLAENRARSEAEAMAQAAAQDQTPEQTPAMAESAPMASDEPTGMADVAETPGDPWPVPAATETDAARVDAPAPAKDAPPAEIAEPTPLLATAIAEPRPAKPTPPPGRASGAERTTSPLPRPWAQSTRPDSAGAGTRPDAVQFASAEPAPADDPAETAMETDSNPDMAVEAEADAGAAAAADEQSADESVDDRLADDETLAEATDDPIAEPSDTGMAEPADQVAALDEAPAWTPGGDGDHAVQFASYTSEDRAWRGWSALQADAADILGDIEPTVRAAQLGGTQGLVYRLRTAPGPADQAKRLCDDLKGRGIACLVVKTPAQSDEQDAPKGRATL